VEEAGQLLRIGSVVFVASKQLIRTNVVTLGLGEGGDRSAVNRAVCIRVAGLSVGVSSWAGVWQGSGIEVEDVEEPGSFFWVSRFVDMSRTQDLIRHLRLPKAAKDDLTSFLESEPSGSLKANVTEDICPSLKATGFLTYEGSC
jgi:hypothetical protein